MKCFRFLIALLLAGGFTFAHVDASPILNHAFTLEEGGDAATPEEKEALYAASEVSDFTYGELLERYARNEVHVIVIDETHCQVCVETAPGNFIIIDLEEEE